MRQIPGLNANSRATDINDSGQVTGYAEVSGTNGGPEIPEHAFLYDPTSNTTEDLGTLGGPISRAEGINNSGQVVGMSFMPPDPNGNYDVHAFIYDDNSGMRDLFSDDPQHVGGEANAINDSGAVVGNSMGGPSSIRRTAAYESLARSPKAKAAKPRT